MKRRGRLRLFDFASLRCAPQALRNQRCECANLCGNLVIWIALGVCFWCWTVALCNHGGGLSAGRAACDCATTLAHLAGAYPPTLGPCGVFLVWRGRRRTFCDFQRRHCDPRLCSVFRSFFAAVRADRTQVEFAERLRRRVTSWEHVSPPMGVEYKGPAMLRG